MLIIAKISNEASACYNEKNPLKSMFLIVGLGNPGRKYTSTRHNIGFAVLDKFQGKNNFPEFSLSKESNALTSTGKIGDKKVVLAKPQTFMNNSGKAVKILTANYSLPSDNLIIVHDDIDLSLGKIRISKNRNAAGHKGVESIIKEIKTKNFIRIRIGIGEEPALKKLVKDFVLRKFTKEEKKIIKEAVEKSCLALEIIVKEGLEKAMMNFNRKRQ